MGMQAGTVVLGGRPVLLVAPSCSADARKLLEEYGMKLEIAS